MQREKVDLEKVFSKEVPRAREVSQAFRALNRQHLEKNAQKVNSTQKGSTLGPRSYLKTYAQSTIHGVPMDSAVKRAVQYSKEPVKPVLLSSKDPTFNIRKFDLLSGANLQGLSPTARKRAVAFLNRVYENNSTNAAEKRGRGQSRKSRPETAESRGRGKDSQNQATIGSSPPSGVGVGEREVKMNALEEEEAEEEVSPQMLPEEDAQEISKDFNVNRAIACTLKSRQLALLVSRHLGVRRPTDSLLEALEEAYREATKPEVMGSSAATQPPPRGSPGRSHGAVSAREGGGGGGGATLVPERGTATSRDRSGGIGGLGGYSSHQAAARRDGSKGETPEEATARAQRKGLLSTLADALEVTTKVPISLADPLGGREEGAFQGLSSNSERKVE
uniref:Uncharacterized protein n=1 Tax=Chromera velia CCMP2878 TaxID=1169474 RepID=A0A0K6S8G5_9ALVE|eukprot:Cvel_6096.t1-p1 / transcript=Cvel_6096.t1 / gene=Cvel_6096 / organism=Chromera_velia_CCMP2878 / gene_product=hypothetical protein / transcript_product=hypothetical protein / location=Cvel_scaffold293:96931-99880(+) / protein_length=390 / sequence_SO=supercontig / SO=protein_coding / is_pseudo=false